MPTPIDSTVDDPAGGFRLTGFRVLLILLGAFGFVFVVNGFMVYEAVRSFSGTVSDTPYNDSQRYNREIAAARAQAARGWQVEAVALRAGEGRAEISLTAKDAAGRPITGTAFHATLQSPIAHSKDRTVELAPVSGSAGVYHGIATEVQDGKWTLLIEASSDKERLFYSQNTIMLQ